MKFFHQYKDLFEVPDGTPFPTRKLSINNSLFIDQPFVPTYAQSFSINSKLKALKRDYDELEDQAAGIEVKHENVERKRKSFRTSSKTWRKEEIPTKDHTKKTENVQTGKDMERAQRGHEDLVQKRPVWLHDEQKNLQKHNEMDYIFGHKLLEDQLKNVQETRIPKADNFIFGNANSYSSPKHEPFKPKHRNKSNVQQPPNHDTLGSQTNHSHQHSLAVSRREDARRNLQSRREKLVYLLRTSWQSSY